jgi:hypothetical protein
MQFFSPKDFLDKLNNWFNGLIAIPLLAVAYGYLEIFSGGLQGMFSLNNYVIGTIILFLLGYSVVAVQFYKKSIKLQATQTPLQARVENYLRISKQYYLKIFLVSIITVLGLYLSGSIAFAGFYAFLLFILSIYRPALLTVANKLRLKGAARTLFLKENAISKEV